MLLHILNKLPFLPIFGSFDSNKLIAILNYVFTKELSNTVIILLLSLNTYKSDSFIKSLITE